ncbi:MAG: nitrite reductase large subunit NirB, partial [Sphingomonadales bacterium]
MSATQKLVVIGNGMAPGRALEKLFEAAPGAFDVTIFNAETRTNYDRILLSPVLSGEKSYEDIVIHGDGWYENHGVTLLKGHKVVAIDREARTVTSEHGVTTPYDKLLIATGSTPVIIPVPGHKLPGVLTYRDMDDVSAMMVAAQSGGSAVVIGGGLLGLEAAAGLKERGMDVTVLHLMPTLMERQLDATAGHMLRRELESRGITVITEANTEEILGDTYVEGVRLKDGRVIPAKLVIMAVGIRPNAALAKDAGLEVNRGILVDPSMRTSDPDIYAVGECVEFNGAVYGLVAPLYEMAGVVASGLAGQEAAFVDSALATKLKVTGINLYSAGDFAEGEGRDEIVLRDARAGVYKRLVLEGNRMLGAVLYGETGDGAWFFQMIREGTDISDIRENLIFGPAFVGGGGKADPTAAVAALPDNAEICGCNGVCKGKIVGAISENGLTSLDDVRAHTKASASCGSCTGLVEQLLTLTLGDGYNPAAVKPVCTCTDLSHADVRRLIVAKGLKSVPDVMQELEWKSSGGCAKCKPALNYYLLSTWPGEYEDDYQSRFINERVHANIQKDGTYSVVPRMWGGVTSARELRAIADVVEKYEIPTVKCTGG